MANDREFWKRWRIFQEGSQGKIDSRSWRKMKYDIGDQIEGLVEVGEDYSVFQNAKYTAKTLKQIQKLWSKLG